MTKHAELSQTEASVRIVSAYLSKNSIPANELPGFIETVFDTIKNLPDSATKQLKQNSKPAVPIKQSLQRDYLVCLEDGLQFKSLKRHLKTKYDLTPEEYRRKWGLSPDYPMVAPAYAEVRSNIAKNIRLGTTRKKAS